MKFRYIYDPDKKQIIEREDLMILVEGELAPDDGSTLKLTAKEPLQLGSPGRADISREKYRAVIRNSLEVQVNKAIELQIAQATQELITVRNQVIQQLIETCRADIRKAVQAEKEKIQLHAAGLMDYYFKEVTKDFSPS